MSIFDSKAEAEAASFLLAIGGRRVSDLLPEVFTDQEGSTFQVRPDFRHEATGLLIEFKAAALNSKTTKAASERALASKLAYRGFLTLWDHLQHGWNHSKFKQLAVQRELTPSRFVVVFKDAIDYAEASAYTKLPLVFLPLAALPSYLAFLKLHSLGLAVSFCLEGESAEGESLPPLALGPITAEFA